MNPSFADDSIDTNDGNSMRRTRLFTLTFAAVLAATMTTPALAQDSDELNGVDRALEAARQAVELVADFGEEGAGSETPDPGAEDPGTKCKSNNGKSDEAKSNNGKSEESKSDGVRRLRRRKDQQRQVRQA